MNTAIKIDRITKIFGSRVVLDDISFRVNKGEVHGFLGPNGAGKSTTMKILSGIIAPTSGDVEIQGLSISSNLDVIKGTIGILPEQPPLYLDFTVEEFLKLSLRLRNIKDQTLYLKTVEKTGLGDVQKRLIGNLSKGFKQRVGVASAIVFNPQIIILDEPTVGLDPASIMEMRNLIKSLANDHTVILSSHLLHEVSLSCSHITIINQGKILTTGPLDKIQSQFAHKKSVRLVLKDKNPNLEFLKKLNFVSDIKKVNECDFDVFLNTHEEKRHELVRELVEQKLNLLELSESKMDLESIFLEMTKGQK